MPEEPEIDIGPRAGRSRADTAAVVLGSDVIVAAHPATRARIAEACRAAGFDIVFWATTGEELVAGAYLRALGGVTDPVVIGCSCPTVARLLERAGPAAHYPTIRLVAPPVAAARQIRASVDGPVTVTYVGTCEGAADPEIDVRYAPSTLLALLERRGIRIDAGASEVRADAGEAVRFASIPAGLPALRHLARAPVSRVLRATTGEALERGELPTGRSDILLDLAAAAGCACAIARPRVEELEPPRATVALVQPAAGLDLSPGRRLPVADPSRPRRESPMQAAVPAALAAPLPTPLSAAPAVERRGHDMPVRPASGRARWLAAGAAVAAIAVVATLGVAAYRLAAGGGGSGRPAAPATGVSGGTLAADTAVGPVVGTPPPAPVSPVVAGTPSTGRPLDSLTISQRAESAAAAARERRRRAYRVVPGWMPQGRGRWEPIDTTGRARRDTSGAAARPPARPRDTIPTPPGSAPPA